MDFAATFRVGVRALARNKMRTALTMLGVVIGVGAVICTVAIGEGGANQIQEQINNLGDNFIWVEAGSRNLQGVRTGTQGTRTLRVEDAWAIRDSIPLIKKVSPNVDGRIQIIYGNQNWSTTYRGISPEYFRIARWTIVAGTAFSQKEVDSFANACLVGQTVIEQLFGSEDPVGKTIRVGGLPFRVIGVLGSKGQSAFGNDQDDVIMMPYTTAQHKVKGIDWLQDIMLSAVSPAAIWPAQEQITKLLRQRHHLRPDQPDDFNIRHPEDILQAQEDSTRTLTVMLASIASISLVVGGIGIMNIMLVSITERTREIGVRMAVGATEGDVQLQFLSEAVVLSMFGGAVGVLLGMLSSLFVSNMLSWPTRVPTSSIAIAVAFSAAVGVFFGYYPARKAAHLDPIEALRYE